MTTIHILNGPNLNLLGKREPNIYGNTSFETYFVELKKKFPNISLHYFQSNHEGKIIDKIQAIGFTKVGIVINPAGLTHTSVSLGDALAAIDAPTVEVHISDVSKREDFRQVNFVSRHCLASFVGKGLQGYDLALKYLEKIIDT